MGAGLGGRGVEEVDDLCDDPFFWGVWGLMARVTTFGRSNCQGLFVQCLGENFVVRDVFCGALGWLAQVRVNRDFVVVGWGVNIKTKSK